MRERPIIFTGDSVRAILAGRKTQSRRVARGLAHDGTRLCAEQQACPYGAAGARLWVRETWAGMDAFAFVGAHDVEPPQCVGYRADESALIWSDANRPPKPADTTGWNWESPRIRWRSPIHMPRWASRLTLEITSVRVERVQAISEADARAEASLSASPSPCA